jgi:hypothetical protein
VDLDENFVEVMTLKVMSITPKWRTFKLLRWVQLLNHLVDLDEILFGGDYIEEDREYLIP